MATDFDPYNEWLGIKPHERPLTYYRLLGLTDLESNPQVIAKAADERIRHVRAIPPGSHPKALQEILNQVAQARQNLLDAEKKSRYDQQLKKRQTGASSSAIAGREKAAAPVAAKTAADKVVATKPAAPRATAAQPIAALAAAPVAAAVADVPLAKSADVPLAKSADVPLAKSADVPRRAAHTAQTKTSGGLGPLLLFAGVTVGVAIVATGVMMGAYYALRGNTPDEPPKKQVAHETPKLKQSTDDVKSTSSTATPPDKEQPTSNPPETATSQPPEKQPDKATNSAPDATTKPDNPAPQPPVVDPPKADSDVLPYTVWKYKASDTEPGGEFRQTDNGWVETQGGRVFGRFEEKERTKDYIDLFDKGRGIWVRLTPTRSGWTRSKGSWIWAHERNPDE